METLQTLECLIESTSFVWTSRSGYPDRKAVDKLKIWEVRVTSKLKESIGISVF